MRKLRENLFFIFIALFACINNVPHLESAVQNTSLQDITDFSGQGSLNNVSVFRIDASGNVFISTISTLGSAHTTITSQGNFISSGTYTHNNNVIITNSADLLFGSSGVATSSQTTAGASQGLMFPAFLGGTTPAVEGSVLAVTTQTIGQGITVQVSSAIAQDTRIVGIAGAAASIGAVVNVFTSGWVNALTTGTVIPGDVLITTTSALGFLATIQPNLGVSSHTVGIALSSGPAAGGLTKIRLK